VRVERNAGRKFRALLSQPLFVLAVEWDGAFRQELKRFA
jgi:hypothetical protein